MVITTKQTVIHNRREEHVKHIIEFWLEFDLMSKVKRILKSVKFSFLLFLKYFIF